MRLVVYTRSALRDLKTYRKDGPRLLQKINLFASTGQGDVKTLVSSCEKRLRVGDFRVIFEDDGSTMTVTKIAPRGSVYEG
jgi:mRNA interferase RelE/StbE